MRIMQELAALRDSLPISVSSTIFVRSDESHANFMRAMITGLALVVVLS